MRSVLPLVYLGAPALAVIGVSCWGTRILFREPDVPRLQRFAQLALIWVVPFLGALLVVELYRPSRRRRFRASLNAEEMNPTLNQALQPLADGATRAASRRFLMWWWTTLVTTPAETDRTDSVDGWGSNNRWRGP
jgi:hypothetical protein